VAQVIVSRLVATDFVAVVRCDVAVEQGGSGREQRSWGLDCSAVDRPGRECRRLGAVVRCFVAGSRVVVAVVNDVGGSDGGCAGVVTSDVAGKWGVLGCAKVVWVLCWSAIGGFGSEWRRFQGAGGWFGAGEDVVVVGNSTGTGRYGYGYGSWIRHP
jgi:hypothetical protein